jgi:uncharacterized damage-inducible protein DinB
MNEHLVDSVNHNLWATRTLIAFSRAVPRETLDAKGVGTYGTILETFNHVIGSEPGYIQDIIGEQRTRGPDTDDFDELLKRVDEAEGLWRRFLATDWDPEELLLLDDGTYQCPKGLLLAQAFHHGTLHREQICSILTAAGLEPPDLQPWSYADATGRGRYVKP